MVEQNIIQKQIKENSHLVRNVFFVLVGLVFVLIIFLVFYFIILPDEEKCLNVSCDDGNPCTVDECSIRTGICYNNLKKCGSDEKCDVNTGNCEMREVITYGGSGDVLDIIENAVTSELEGSVDGNLATETATTLDETETTIEEPLVEEPVDVMDQIENAIESALAG